MNGHDRDEPSDDVTVVRPKQPAPSTSESPPTGEHPVGDPAPGSPEISALLGRSLNPLVQVASPLLLLAVQLRHSTSAGDAEVLREQVQIQIRKFENRMLDGGVRPQDVTAGRYVLCAMVDEAVLNSPWGEHSNWSQKTLLMTFHNESYGGAKFFQLLDRLLTDVPRHIDLIELMYACLALGFSGRYQIEAGGRARLADIQDDLYRRIRSQRGQPEATLAPHWRGIEDRRSPLVRYVPLWVFSAAAVCLVLAVLLWFHTRLNALASPISATVARIGLEIIVPPGGAPQHEHVHENLKMLLAAEEQADLLTVEEMADGGARIRLGAAQMFASGGVTLQAGQRALLERVGTVLERLPGRIIVVGHTDDLPIRSLRFKDNYELSTARATAVADVLAAELGDPDRLEVVGAGASQPIATPQSLPENRARNRRVEILYQPGD